MRDGLDTLLPIETPEGVDVELRPAGPAARGLALGVDLFLQGALCLLGAPLILSSKGGMGLFLLVLFAVTWFYGVAFEVLWEGQTPGKWLMGLRVLLDDGQPVSFGASALRNLLRSADLLPGGYALGLLSMVLDPAFRRIGDLAAGTVVVHGRGANKGGKLDEVADLVPPVGLRAEEQRLLVDLARRSEALGDGRATELAGLLDPLSPDGRPTTVTRVQGWARWLVGAS